MDVNAKEFVPGALSADAQEICGGGGLGLIHECPACTLSQMEMGLKLLVADYLYNLSRPFMPPSLQHCP